MSKNCRIISAISVTWFLLLSRSGRFKYGYCFLIWRLDFFLLSSGCVICPARNWISILRHLYKYLRFDFASFYLGFYVIILWFLGCPIYNFFTIGCPACFHDSHQWLASGSLYFWWMECDWESREHPHDDRFFFLQ